MNADVLLDAYEAIQPYTAVLFTVLAITAATLTSFHVLLSRREPGAALAWIALVWLAPLVGVIAYLALGINRIRRRAEQLRPYHYEVHGPSVVSPVTADNLDDHLPDVHHELQQLVPFVDGVVDGPLLPGNRIIPLLNGDQAFPEMLDAIEAAEHHVHFATYIFDNDDVGRRFVATLDAAHARGVEVRVLIDAAGLRYSFPSIYGRLKRAGVPVARFLPSRLPPHIMTMNLRNHRKIMVVDGHLGFTGGLNIRAAHLLESRPTFPTRDLHFRVEGPVVTQMQEVFADDWEFASGEKLRDGDYFPLLPPVGDTLVRGIPDGPDEHLDKLRWTLLGAITAARTRIRIVTPYFIPDKTIVSSLSLAAKRGVDVEIILPELNNLPFVQWASMAHLGPLLAGGCTLHLKPPPFDHCKLVTVDDLWVLVGSANIDPRSLRLNFEFNLECWSPPLANRLNQVIDESLDGGRVLTLEEYDARSRLLRLRDGVAALFSPYL